MALIPGSGAGADQLTQYIERIERLEDVGRAERRRRFLVGEVDAGGALTHDAAAQLRRR